MGNFATYVDPNAGHLAAGCYTGASEEERAALAARAATWQENHAVEMAAKAEKARFVYEEAIASSLALAERARKAGYEVSAARALKRAETLRAALAAGKQWLEKGKPVH